jgi:hypothetical protein
MVGLSELEGLKCPEQRRLSVRCRSSIWAGRGAVARICHADFQPAKAFRNQWLMEFFALINGDQEVPFFFSNRSRRRGFSTGHASVRGCCLLFTLLPFACNEPS